MGTRTGIAWTDATWSPLVGCQKVSSGCAHCYAVREVHRLAHNAHPQIARDFAALVERHSNGQLDWTGTVRLIPGRLTQPQQWRKPRRIFVNSMSDVFAAQPHEIAAIFGAMAAAPQHIFQVLTKRPEAMRALFTMPSNPDLFHGDIWDEIAEEIRQYPHVDTAIAWQGEQPYLRNVWLGVSVETRAYLPRLPCLRKTHAALRFVSFEPLLEDLGDLSPWLPGLDWAIVGGESGPNARPCHLAWLRSVVRQCQAADIPCFVKQLGSQPYHGREDGFPYRRGDYVTLKDRKGADPAEWPAGLQVQEFPKERA